MPSLLPPLAAENGVGIPPGVGALPATAEGAARLPRRHATLLPTSRPLVLVLLIQTEAAEGTSLGRLVLLPVGVPREPILGATAVTLVPRAAPAVTEVAVAPLLGELLRAPRAVRTVVVATRRLRIATSIALPVCPPLSGLVR